MMKNTVRINHVECLLVMDRTFAKRAENVRSEEYEILQKARRDYPTYTVITRHIKRCPNKETYKGLTYGYMEDYIISHETNPEVVLNEFYELQLISQCHSKAHRYPAIKRWFLNRYPEVKMFGKPSFLEASTLPPVQEAISSLPAAS